jgi:transposase
VKSIDKAALREQLEPAVFEDLELLVMDGFAIQKGHRYATVIVEPRSKRVVWVGRGRSREEIRPFFELLGPERCRRIRAIAIDMNTAYELEIRRHCPNAEIVYDLYHVVAKYGREVIDRVRVDEANRLRDDRKARRVVKSARWLLLRNPENLRTPDDAIRLQELLAANRNLFKVYVLRDDLKRLWAYRQRAAAQRLWNSWYRRAVRSRIGPLVRFAKRLKPYLSGILAHSRWPLHTSLIEGINNKIKVIKRMAYGFRDDEYFFLKIRAAFPGNQ